MSAGIASQAQLAGNDDNADSDDELLPNALAQLEEAAHEQAETKLAAEEQLQPQKHWYGFLPDYWHDR